MTKHCWKCGWVYPLSGVPGRGESCHKCGSDLRVCRNCSHYKPKLAYQCDDRRAEEVVEKTSANFCEYYEFARREFQSGPEADPREAKARDQLKKLFGD